MSTFPNILKNLWWKLDALLDYDMIKASAKMAALESIRNGVTYIIDHHSSPHFAENSLKIIGETLDSFKLRSILCFETTDRNGGQLRDKGIKENLNYYQNNTSSNRKSLFGMHASFTLENNTLNTISEIINHYDLGVHVHLCEDSSDNEISYQKYSESPVKRFGKYGMLNEKCILAHGIHLNSEDYEIINDSGSSMVFNIDSNMNNSVGLQKYRSFISDTPILIGTDGMHSNYARSVKELFLQLRHSKFSFDEAFTFVSKSFFDQQKFIKRFFGDFPELKVDDRADFIIWDYVPPAPLNKKNFWGHFIYGVVERPVKYVLHNGKVLLDNYMIKNVDDTEISAEIYEQGKKLSTKFNEAK
jgi:cytosine/adenosine deaminase-related metal-dependent hydrolase